MKDSVTTEFPLTLPPFTDKESEAHLSHVVYRSSPRHDGITYVGHEIRYTITPDGKIARCEHTQSKHTYPDMNFLDRSNP